MSAPWDHLTLSDCRPVVSREVIKSVSAKIGLPFPKLYVDFLLAHNGGSVENLRLLPRRFPLQRCKQDTHGLIQVFFNVSTGDVVNLAREYKVFRDRIPTGLLPIASDPGGNLICLACKGKGKGQVFFWDQNFEANTDEGEKVGWDNVYFIAGSLEKFFRGLDVFPEDIPLQADIPAWMETKLGSFGVQDRANIVHVIKGTTSDILRKTRKHLERANPIYLRRLDELAEAAIAEKQRGESSKIAQMIEQIDRTVGCRRAMTPGAEAGERMLDNIVALGMTGKDQWLSLEAAKVKKWKAKYLVAWKDFFDRQRHVDPAWKKKRRAYITESFDRLIALCRSQEK
jgi:hypothetical protein